jgi:hypothetical protein
MPKKSSRRSKKRTRKTKRPKPTARVRSIPGRMRSSEDDEARLDGCDVEFTASDATPDDGLPQATGGVETTAIRRRR